MPIWGRKKREAEEELSSAKKLIIKVKKKGIDTSEAQELYKEAKRAIKNGKYGIAAKKIEEAKKSAKKAYAKGIKRKLELRISKLKKKIKDMEAKNLDSEKANKKLKKARTSLKAGIKSYKEGLKHAKEGLKIAQAKVQAFNKVSSLQASTSAMLRRIEDQNPDLSKIKDFRVRLAKLDDVKAKREIEEALVQAQKLNAEVKIFKERYFKVYEAISALKKVVADVEVLGANIDAQSKLDEAMALLSSQKFKTARKLAFESTKEISDFLSKYRDAKYHVDMAQEKVLEVKGWGFSAFDAEKTLNSSKEALNENRFEEAIERSKEAKEKASTIRERHAHSLELIHSARDEIAKIKTKGADITEYEDIINKAEDEFNRGDYGASDEKIKGFFEMIIKQ
ncbi:MAG: hypothetical protein JSW00_15710 [Thermoplasmata archaeon]|nr:MAG: hypothetical protein JSW00_15710 [Thermoplasmata archaeon]